MPAIFVQNTTVLDCAIADDNQGLIGMSWFVSATFLGDLTEEGMILDFAEAKKIVKKTIDDLWDHKTIITNKHILKKSANTLCTHGSWQDEDEKQNWGIEAPESCFALVPKYEDAFTLNNIKVALELDIAAKLMQMMPPNITQIKITLESPIYNEHTYINYTHSLQCHKGNCQRFHGHAGLLQVINNNQIDLQKSGHLLKKFQSKYFINKTCLFEANNALFNNLLSTINNAYSIEKLSGIYYQSTQGDFKILLPKNKIISMNSESTIEAMAHFFWQEIANNNQNIQVIAYEGLHKGALGIA